jgi:hypothetical protein
MFIIGLLIGIAIVIYAMAFSSAAEREYNGDDNNFKL